ncbi:MAG: propionyl-CoA carboxylase [Polyangiaceae bacterium]|nr:propionyl-CoA carboxylase [Polyangiaceae bacterium]
MTWDDDVERLNQRRETAKQMGGKEAVQKMHDRGRLTVRERIDTLTDSDSFREIGRIAGTTEDDHGTELFTPANAVVGTGKIGGRRAVICGDDFTLRGAAYTTTGLKKALYAEKLAIERRIPLVRLLDSGGASIQGISGRRGQSGFDMTAASQQTLLSVEALATVPVVCAALGAVAGFPAARLVASHFSVMTGDAQVMTGGPALVERALGQKITKEELGGAHLHSKSGVVDNIAKDEPALCAQITRFLSYLPSHSGQLAPMLKGSDPAGRADEELLQIMPSRRRRAYDVRQLLTRIVDHGSFFEKTPFYGRSMVTGLARLNGHSVGVMANDCMRDGGAMTAESAQKVRRFIELCDTFHLPMLSFIDQPGFMIGKAAEEAGTIRYGTETLFTAVQSRVPWLAIVLRKSFGVAQGIQLGPGATVIAWPSAEVGSMPVEGGVALGFRREIESADDPAARRRELEDEMALGQSIFPRAEDFGIHDLIDPRETRVYAADWLDQVTPQLDPSQGPMKYSLRP